MVQGPRQEVDRVSLMIVDPPWLGSELETMIDTSLRLAKELKPEDIVTSNPNDIESVVFISSQDKSCI